MNDWTNGVSTLYQADAREIPLPDASVHCVVTSPPYWGLRDYGLGEWEGGDAECGHQQQLKQYAGKRPDAGNKREGWAHNTCGLCGAVNTPSGIGLEPTLGEWVQNIVAVMREVRRVLRDDGTVWLNLGDSYSGGGRKTSTLDDLDGTIRVRNSDHQRPTYPMGLDAKNLIGQPWRVAFALQDDGWILRSAIVWHKPNPMPESVTDRPTSAYEMVFLLSKEGRYFYDAEAVREPGKSHNGQAGTFSRSGLVSEHIIPGQSAAEHRPRTDRVPNGANARNVWTIPTQGRPDAHFAPSRTNYPGAASWPEPRSTVFAQSAGLRGAELLKRATRIPAIERLTAHVQRSVGTKLRGSPNGSKLTPKPSAGNPPAAATPNLFRLPSLTPSLAQEPP